MTGVASAPASSANLGPGFDCIALALGLRCVARAVPAEHWGVLSGGVDPGPEAAAFVTRAARSAAGERPLSIEIESDVPRTSGLGSSAAVAVSVAAAARRAHGGAADRDEVFRVVAALEGHPDNAAAAVYGGLVAVAGDEVVRLELSPDLVPVVALPAFELSTPRARRALPDQIPHAAAARSVARAVALVAGLRSADPAALAAAAGDEIHEGYRAVLAPETAKLVGVARSAGAVHAAWSGAGPAVLALVTVASQGDVVAALQDVIGAGGRVFTPGVDYEGLR